VFHYFRKEHPELPIDTIEKPDADKVQQEMQDAVKDQMISRKTQEGVKNLTKQVNTTETDKPWESKEEGEHRETFSPSMTSQGQQNPSAAGAGGMEPAEATPTSGEDLNFGAFSSFLVF
jgi:hypothetical protein